MKEADLKLIAGSSNLPLAEEIARYIGIELTPTELRRFSDGEISVKVADNVRGSDVFLIQSTSYPANDHIMEVMLLVDALRRASARRITVVTPYYGYGRQDRKVEPRVPISAKVVATMFEAVGVRRMLCLDLHADQIQGFFEIPVDHLFAAPVLIQELKKRALQNLVIVSPDSGGAERARFFAKQLNASLAIIDKRRERANEAEIMHIVGSVEGKTCVLVDDMIDTAGTIVKGAFALYENGAKEIYAAATHAVLSGPAIEKLRSSPLKEILLTNSIKIPPEKILPQMKILSVAPLIAEAIVRIHDERSVSSLFL
ncbi:MAG: ribose-phosphate pyrophosphokinase [Leptospiraceae bacterium]|nr:ribose-phosphate pyrophosphokinase [Leptospiraceae bacterium]MDW8306652.1 ribose-phosphate pyrophosphokinase [Leptospiraceae bacterium]